MNGHWSSRWPKKQLPFNLWHPNPLSTFSWFRPFVTRHFGRRFLWVVDGGCPATPDCCTRCPLMSTPTGLAEHQLLSDTTETPFMQIVKLLMAILWFTTERILKTCRSMARSKHDPLAQVSAGVLSPPGPLRYTLCGSNRPIKKRCKNRDAARPMSLFFYPSTSLLWKGNWSNKAKARWSCINNPRCSTNKCTLMQTQTRFQAMMSLPHLKPYVIQCHIIHPCHVEFSYIYK